MAPRSHRTRTERVLIAGDVDDLSAIQDVLDALPVTSYGQVFVEAVDASETVQLRAPGRVTVTWLARDTRPSRSRALVFAARGEALAEAIVGWAAEWMPGETDDMPNLLWIGCASSMHVTAVAEHLRGRVEAVQALPQA